MFMENTEPHIEKKASRQTEFPLVKRFQRCRWSKTRNAIHDLVIGASAILPKSEWNNATTSITRLQEAYNHTRHWRMRTVSQGIRIDAMPVS